MQLPARPPARHSTQWQRFEAIEKALISMKQLVEQNESATEHRGSEEWISGGGVSPSERGAGSLKQMEAGMMPNEWCSVVLDSQPVRLTERLSVRESSFMSGRQAQRHAAWLAVGLSVCQRVKTSAAAAATATAGVQTRCRAERSRSRSQSATKAQRSQPRRKDPLQTGERLTLMEQKTVLLSARTILSVNLFEAALWWLFSEAFERPTRCRIISPWTLVVSSTRAK